MPKWVIKRRWEGAPLEVREYIDSVEEAKEYPYIERVIKKYGVDKVVPLAMNDVGGYHHLPRDDKEIVAIIESDEKPVLSPFKVYPINNPVIRDGWLAPDGTTFTCGYMGHIGCARELRKAFALSDRRGTGQPDEILLDNGWIKIMQGTWFGHWKKVTDKQMQTLERVGITRRFDE